MKHVILIILILLGGSQDSWNKEKDNYDELWSQVKTYEDEGLLRSAYELVLRIQEKAESESRNDQLVKSLLYKSRVSVKFKDREASDYILDFESELEQMHDPAARALLHSILGELYQYYGMANLHLFSDRSFINTEKALPFSSLKELQLESSSNFLESIEYMDDQDLNSYEAVFYEDEADEWVLKASNFKEFILFRAIYHFMNSSSFVTIVKPSYILNDPLLFSSDSVFSQLTFDPKVSENYKLEALKLFQKAALDGSISMETRLLLNTIRLQFVRDNFATSQGDELFTDSLIKLINDTNARPGSGLAYVKLIDHYLNKAYRTNKTRSEIDYFNEAFRWIQKYTQDNVNGDYMNTVLVQRKKLMAVHFDLEMEQVVASQKEFLAYINYRNADKAFFRLYKLSPEELKAYRALYRNEDRLELSRKLYLFDSWDQELPSSEDRNYHGLEVPMKAMDHGSYLLMSSSSDKWKVDESSVLNMHLIHVSDLSYITNSHNVDKIKARVVDRMTGEPVSGAKVELMSYNYNSRTRSNEWNLNSSAITDSKGVVHFNKFIKNFSLLVRKGDDVLDLRSSHYIRSQQSDRKAEYIRFFTDRSIYRPSQSIYFKAILFEQGSRTGLPELIKNRKLKLKFRDMNNQIIAEQELTSNEYGSISGQFHIPENIILGTVSLEAEGFQITGRQLLRVEEYKRPKIKAEINKLDESYKLGDVLRLKGKVESYSGLMVEDAQVEYQLYRKAYIPIYYSLRSPFPYNNSKELVLQGSTSTDDKGAFEIVFESKDTDSNKRSYSYELQCHIVDVTGESTDVNKNFHLSRVPYELEFDLPETVFSDEIGTTIFKAMNSEDEAQEIELDLELIQLECPQKFKRKKYWDWITDSVIEESDYARRFPFDHSADYYDYSKWPEIMSISSQTIKGKEIKTDILSGIERGFYKLLIKAKDLKGNELELERFIQVSDMRKRALPDKVLWLKNLKEEYKVGDEMSVQLNAPFKNYTIYYTLRQADQIRKEGILDQKKNSFSYILTEKDRGGLELDLIMVYANRDFKLSRSIHVPWGNKELDIEIERMRDNTRPGSKEEIKLKVKAKEGVSNRSELLAAMYDSSLDAFTDHSWNTDWYPKHFSRTESLAAGFGRSYKFQFSYSSRLYYSTRMNSFYPRLNWFGFSIPGAHRPMPRSAYKDGDVMIEPYAAQEMLVQNFEGDQIQEESQLVEIESQRSPELKLRENFDETLFFYPSLETDEEGNIEFKYTMNDALTQWRLMLMAHDSQARFGYAERMVQSSLPFMLEAHLPRFVRQGDSIILTAKLSNLSMEEQSTVSRIQILDSENGKDITTELLGDRTIEMEAILPAGKTKVLDWELHVPDDLRSAISILMRSSSGDFQDGVKHVIPVLSNKIFVTESMPLYCNESESKEFEFKGLEKLNRSATIESFQYKLEYLSDPSWMVLKALPSLIDQEHRSSTGIIDAIFAHFVGLTLYKNNTAISDYLDELDVNSIEGPLAKNAELKFKDLEETPWLKDSQAEEQSLIGLKYLANENQREYQLNSLIMDLKKRQVANGGFSWMPGARDNWYVSQYVLEQIARMKLIGIDEIDVLKKFDLQSAVGYIDERFLDYYEDHDSIRSHINPMLIHYLFVRSSFPNVSMQEEHRSAMKDYLEQTLGFWTKSNSYLQALLGMAYFNFDMQEEANKILQSLLERRLVDDELGAYWNDQAGFYWYELNIEKQAGLIQFFEMMDVDPLILKEMRKWLMKNKQVNSWPTSKATASAVFSFYNASNFEFEAKGVLDIVFPDGKEHFELDVSKAEHLNHSFEDKVDLLEHARIGISNKSNRDSWGALHWQYFEDIGKLENYDTGPVVIRKEIARLVREDNEEYLDPITKDRVLRPGDIVRTRIEISVDRAMEFIVLKDMRASGIESMNVLSQHKFQNGLSYYETTEDLASYFYIEFLPKRNFVFEYDQVVSHKGRFESGISSIQSMYAPEFNSHSSSTFLRSGE